jgi:hypothetical protein
MHVDNYTRVVLTVIAVCLVYLCAREAAPAVVAQEQDAPTRVVITGIALEQGGPASALPVGVVGEMRLAGSTFSPFPLQPVRVRIADAVEIHTTRPIKVEADEPLPVRAVREPGTQRPGLNEP